VSDSDSSDSSDSDSSDSDSSEHGTIDPPALKSSNKRCRAATEEDYTPINGFRTEPPDIQPSKKSKKSKRPTRSPKRYLFKEKYLKKWKWLAYDTERKVAYCSFSGCSMYDPAGRQLC
jgi:hypothetical protein